MTQLASWRRVLKTHSGAEAIDAFQAGRAVGGWLWVPVVSGDLAAQDGGEAYVAFLTGQHADPSSDPLLFAKLLLPPYSSDLTLRFNLHSLAEKVLAGPSGGGLDPLGRQLAMTCLAAGLRGDDALAFDALNTVVALPVGALVFASAAERDDFETSLRAGVGGIEDEQLGHQLVELVEAQLGAAALHPWQQSAVAAAHAATKTEMARLGLLLDPEVADRLPHLVEAPLLSYAESRVAEPSRVGVISIYVSQTAGALLRVGERSLEVVQQVLEVVRGLFGGTVVMEPIALMTGSVEVVVRLRARGEGEGEPPAPSLQAVTDALTRVFSTQGTQEQFGPMSGLIRSLDQKKGEGVDVTVEVRGVDGHVRQMRLNSALAHQRVIEMTEAARIPTVDVPQANDLDRVFRLVELVAAGRPVDVPGLRLERDAEDIKPRQVAYYRHGARILGLVDSYEFMGLTPAGVQIAGLTTTAERLVRAAVLFEVTALGRAWLDWSRLRSVADLDPDSAAAFLSAVSDLNAVTANRRASTLKTWAEAFRGALRTTG